MTITTKTIRNANPPILSLACIAWKRKKGSIAFSESAAVTIWECLNFRSMAFLIFLSVDFWDHKKLRIDRFQSHQIHDLLVRKWWHSEDAGKCSILVAVRVISLLFMVPKSKYLSVDGNDWSGNMMQPEWVRTDNDSEWQIQWGGIDISKWLRTMNDTQFRLDALIIWS